MQCLTQFRRYHIETKKKPPDPNADLLFKPAAYCANVAFTFLTQSPILKVKSEEG